MVYCGKPSKGCANCRKRKIRCDQSEPSCLECQRARFSCPGYRDLASFHFRDQSQDVIRKANLTYSSRSVTISSNNRKKEISWNGKKDSRSTNHNTDRNTDDISSTTGIYPGCGFFKIQTPIAICAKDESTCVFLHSYVFDDDITGPKVHLTTSQLVQHATSSRAVRCAISSIGLAVLSNRRNSPGLMVEARNEYAIALRLTNMALRERSKSLKDTTLNAVVLLGMFEVMSCGAPKSVENWQMHIGGAASLLELWHSHSVRNFSGIQLFSQIRVELMANCLRTQTYVPKTVRKLSNIARAYRSEESVRAEDLVNLVAQVSDLLADVRYDGIPDPAEVIDRARVLDERLQSWSQNLSSRWHYEICHVSRQDRYGTEHLYQKCFHTYPDIWACNIWSYYRVARILVNLLLRDRLQTTLFAPLQWAELLDHVKENLDRLSIDIVRSVPFAMSLFLRSSSLPARADNSNNHHVRDRSNEGKTSGGCLGGYFILWPLYVAASIQIPSSPLKVWGAERLEHIGHHMGIGQALLMARAIRGEVPHEELSIYDYCHSYRP